MTRTRWLAVLAGVALVAGAGCGGSDAGSEAPDTAAQPADEEPTEEGSTGVDDASVPNDGEAVVPQPEAPDEAANAPDGPSAEEPAAPTAPQGPPLVEGLPVLELLGPPETDAGRAPLFSWASVDGASSYRLALLGPEGPIWSWTGEETEVYLGGLDFEQPPGWAGPQLVPGSCWSVVARDGSGDVIAVSSFVPVSADATVGPACVPPGG